MSVTPIDFGKDRREAARTFSRLMGLVEAHEAAVLADPVKYLDMAGKEIGRLRHGIREARDALRRTVNIAPRQTEVYEPIRTVNVSADEYERLKRAANIITALAEA